jgi:signal peptidase I
LDQYRSEITPEPGGPDSQERGLKLREFLRDTVETVLIAVVLFLAINAVSARIRVESVSMQPSLFAGNYVIVNKLAYRLGEPQRGDVIVFKYPPDPSREPYIKRVIGLPGDLVRIENDSVSINGELLSEPYLTVATQQGGEWQVPQGNLFVMGDNRNNSSDSRAWGMVPLENVIGKALVIYWPPDQWGVLGFPYAVAAGE